MIRRLPAFAALVALVLAGCTDGDGAAPSVAATTPAAAVADLTERQRTYEIGDTVPGSTDPGTTLTVSDPRTVDMGQIATPDHGQFLAVTVTAVAGEDWQLDVGDFRAVDSEGYRYEWAIPYAGLDEAPLPAYNALRAGETVKGAVVFDTPADVTSIVYAPGGQTLITWTL